jgi:hypothetical protein
MTELAGIDVAWSKPDPAAAYRAGYRFVIGYLGGSAGKAMDAAHLSAFRVAGFAVGLVFEGTADRALGGAAAGAVDGALAEAGANAAGYPTDAVLFAAVDFPANAAQIAGPVRAYLTAFDAATRRPVGVYGSHAVVEALVTPGARPVRYGWQTAAWSNDPAGRPLLSAKACLYQRNKHTWPAIAGFATINFDENVVCAPVPLAGGTLTPPGAAPAPAVDPTPAPVVAPTPPAFDAAAWVAGWRTAQGATGAIFEHLQQWASDTFPAYDSTPVAPKAAVYGPRTVAFLRELAHRAAVDRSWPGSHGDLARADGANIGNDLAAALVHYGFAGYLTRIGWRP